MDFSFDQDFVLFTTTMVTSSFCSLKVRDQFNLKKHHNSNHKCKYCSNVYSKKENLKLNMKSCSQNTKPKISCSKCEKIFSRKAHKIEHEKICGLKKIEKHLLSKLVNFEQKSLDCIITVSYTHLAPTRPY